MNSRRGVRKAPGAEAEKARRAPGRGTLAVILAAYLALAVAYSRATPVGVSPDELGHAEYIRYLVAHHRLPVFGGPGLAYEAHQPPLYYVLAAPIWAGVGAAPAQLPLTEWHHRPGIWVLAGRAAAQGQAVRLLTTLIGAAGLALIWALIGLLYPGDQWLRVAATSLAAFLPMRLALAAAVSNDLLLELLFTASLLVMALMIRRGYTHRRACALGAALGAALLTKTTAVLLLPLVAITLLFVSWRRQSPAAPARSRQPSRGPSAASGPGARRWVSAVAPLDAGLLFGGCARVFGIALLLAGPWLLRNQLLYGDCLAAHAFAVYFRNVQSTPAGMMAQLGLSSFEFWSRIVGRGTYSSFWGVFGPFTVWMAPPVYQALLIPTALGPVGAVIQARRGRQERDASRQAFGVVLWLSLALVVAGYVRYNLLIVEPQSRFLLSAMAPIALFLARGWLAIAPRRARPVAAVAVTMGMAVLAVYAVAGVILPYYR